MVEDVLVVGTILVVDENDLVVEDACFTIEGGGLLN
jgi:hypothetical protein